MWLAQIITPLIFSACSPQVREMGIMTIAVWTVTHINRKSALTGHVDQEVSIPHQ